MPLQKLNQAANAFASGDFSTRLPEEKGGEIKPLLRAFNQMAEKAEKNDLSHQTFISNVSHDLRTPLTTVSGFVQNMLEGAIPPEKQSHYLRIILDECNRLSRLVQTLLDVSRMSAGKRNYRMDTMDLCELARITLLSFEKRLESKEMEVEISFEKENLLVCADRDAIQQVIYNLTDNAIKFSPTGGTLSMGIRSRGQKAFFSLRNTGEGIPKEELPHLFDRFYKSDRSRGLDKKGMGLGLFIVKSIIDAHKEELWVESLSGSYTEFVFSLPLHSAQKQKNENQR
jgi:signal transduction histidine kinase